MASMRNWYKNKSTIKTKSVKYSNEILSISYMGISYYSVVYVIFNLIRGFLGFNQAL